MLSDADHHDAQLLVDLINTHYLGDGSDMLADAEARRWLHEHFGARQRVPAASALQPLRELREGLRQLAIGNNGDQPDRSAIARADAALRHAPLMVRLGAADRPRAAAPTAGTGSAEEIIAVVALAFLASQIGGVWRRVKACAAPGCRWAFLDLSRNASRRWCDMAECGNRAKNRSWRERHPNQRS